MSKLAKSNCKKASTVLSVLRYNILRCCDKTSTSFKVPKSKFTYLDCHHALHGLVLLFSLSGSD